MAFKTIDHVPSNVECFPICCVDLGFAEEDFSTGLEFFPRKTEASEVFFSDGISQVNQWLNHCQSDGSKECILVIEAPLSIALTSTGNPCHRQIELQRNYENGCAPRSPKGWYYQAGANLTLAAILFLSRLNLPQDCEINLIEGFYCSVLPDEPHASHKKVAEHLRECLLARKGQPLVKPIAERGSVTVVPGLERIFDGIPHILLRQGLTLKPAETP